MSRQFNLAREISAETGARLNDLEIRFHACSTYSYAASRSNLPLIRLIEVVNSGDRFLQELELQVSADLEFMKPRRWAIPALAPGEATEILDCDIDLDSAILCGVAERTNVSITCRLTQGEQLLCERKHRLSLLARDQWAGVEEDPELLAAFVLPGDPVVERLLDSAANILSGNGHDFEINGYRAGITRQVYQVVSAIWSAVAAKGLRYADPLEGLGSGAQNIKTPSQVLSGGVASSLESALLFASTLEAAGLHAVLVPTRERCLVGCWLNEQTFGTLVERSGDEVRTAIDTKSLVVFDSTPLSGLRNSSFDEATMGGRAVFSDAPGEPFFAAIDVERSRLAGMRPIAYAVDDQEASKNRSTSLIRGPRSSTILDVQNRRERIGGTAALRDWTPRGEAIPATPADRVKRWQRKLLDLSLRNRLLNFRQTKQSVPLLRTNLAALASRIQKGTEFGFLPIGTQQSDRTSGNCLVPGRRQEVRSESSKGECGDLQANLCESELTKSLTQLYRSSRQHLSEGGTNTLFLALGFLHWKQAQSDTVFHRAPLVLVPVQLRKQKTGSSFSLTVREDEVRFNATLVQKLKTEFAVDLSRFEYELPVTKDHVDVDQVLEQVRRETRDAPGFEVVDEAVLATFSFSKFLMWKDLSERSRHLNANAFVRHLVHSPEQPFRSDAAVKIATPGEIDQRFDCRELVHPLPADSTQLTAVMAAAEGNDFVLIGPPGTGKSQTIANMIALCLARKKTVLFVAEKTAALEVVHRRLCQHALGDLCLELHSNHADRRRFLTQMENAWLNRSLQTRDEWDSLNERLQDDRDQLNRYVDALHENDVNGLSVFEAMGRSLKQPDLPVIDLGWETDLNHDSKRLDDLEETIHQAARAFQSARGISGLDFLHKETWSASWERELLQHVDQLAESSNQLDESLRGLTRALGVDPGFPHSPGKLSSLRRLADCLADDSSEDYGIALEESFSTVREGYVELENELTSFRRIQDSMTTDYRDQLERIPVHEFCKSWETASASVGPVGWIRKAWLNRRLQGFASSGRANVESDLNAIAMMRAAIARVQKSSLAERVPHWNGVDTDLEQLGGFLCTAERIHVAVSDFENQFAADGEFRKSIASLIGDDSSEHATVLLAREFCRVHACFQDVVTRFGVLCENPDFQEQAVRMPNGIRGCLASILRHRNELQAWTTWREALNRAGKNDLRTFVNGLLRKGVDASLWIEFFRCSYAHWWLPTGIDRHETLQRFRKPDHETTVNRFREMDANARATAANRIRNSVAHRLPKMDAVARKSELGLLRHQINLKRPSKSIRAMISAMPNVFPKLAPCCLMSPLSIAQYLPPDHKPFDVVILDEASQIATWDAIGAISRGKQTIIVGDPNQLPPTNFFARVDEDEQGEELEGHQRDLESILDEASAAGLPMLHLSWHYRSQKESLIAFSNRKYYANQLVTYPASSTEDRAVRLKVVADAIYEGGGGSSKTNPLEAEAIVEDAVARMEEWLLLPENERPSLGVVTFNQAQQMLLQDLFDAARVRNRDLEWFFDDERVEPTVVKNLENIQGDERDVMLFSVTYGKLASGKVTRNFGPLNKDGGDRRLNVAATRAKSEMVVYCSFSPEQLNVEGLSHRGVRDLKDFLGYAQKGAEGRTEVASDLSRAALSHFEDAVVNSLRDRGWQVRVRIGASNHGVSIGVIHPDAPLTFLAGVECDGVSYRNASTAADRDVNREAALRNLGWTIVRVWAPDWWYSPEKASDDLDRSLRNLLSEFRANR